ncbi:hypothetical protein PENNAL_c0037G07929 [Penicillium nalgiovense]|uniref:Uncharacterized protein n=1 Tax=Penicillium nalgiovense TaxID=60175 RepID=A0A1V6Y4D6_PENNA|nr:hypothetical protein PENNAL_c0037G07929 [Penicillium nalgiovense]
MESPSVSAMARSVTLSCNATFNLNTFMIGKRHPLTVAGLSASGQSAGWTINPLRSTTSITTLINHFESDRGGLRLQDNRQAVKSIIHFNKPPVDLGQPPRLTTLINHFQPDRGGLRLQDNRQAGQTTHFDQPPRSTPRATTPSSNHFNKPLP